MEIIEYINSNDIRNYWSEIGYKPSALESAWLVWQGKNQTLKEKHSSWIDIINSFADCSIPAGLFDLPQRPLFDFLKRYIKIEDNLISSFYRKDTNAVYSYRMYFDDGDHDWYNEPALFHSFDEAYDHAKDDGEPPHPNFIEFIKTHIGSEGKKIFMRFNMKKEIVRVDESNYLTNEKDYEIFQEVFRNMSFEFPLPFKKGDIVKTAHALYTLPSYYGDVFAVSSVGKFIYGFTIDNAAVVYNECISDYMDLEYVKAPLTKEKKILDYMSKYIEEKIGMAELLNKYRYTISTWQQTRLNNRTTEETGM